MSRTIDGQLVTDGQTAPETAVRSAVRQPRAIEATNTRKGVYARARIAGPGAVLKRAWAIAIGEQTSIWSAKPDSAAALVRYARDGAWCAPTSVLLRGLGRLDAALIAIPLTVVLDLVEWVIQRPGRRLAAAVLVLILWLVIP